MIPPARSVGRIVATTAAALVVAAAMLPAGTAGAGDGTAEARSATAGYHDVGRAVADGFEQLTDAAGIACIDKPGVGAMGIHYVNFGRVGDPAELAATPELLVYEPQQNGRLRLVAVEYVVLSSAWHADNPQPPTLFGQQFELVLAGNRYGLPDFYALHAWLWKHNPTGMFEDYNPRVSCAHA